MSPHDLPRVISSVRDALVRQTPLIYGSLPDGYRYAGLDDARAKELVIVALDRHPDNEPVPHDLRRGGHLGVVHRVGNPTGYLKLDSEREIQLQTSPVVLGRAFC